MLLFTAKNIAIFFGLASMAFCISTIVLAVEKANLKDDLQDALDKLDTISTITTPSTTNTSPTTTAPSSSTAIPDPSSSTELDPSTPTEPGPTVPGPSSVDPWPTLTVPSSDPTFPTLPPGLPNPEEVIYRLPTDIRPIKYKLYWHPDLEAKTCESTVSVQIEIDNETNLIVMHAKDLEIDAVSILNMMARLRIRVKAFYLAPEREMLFIELEEILYKATPYVVSISYRCRLDGLSGMYASSYLGENGEDSTEIGLPKFCGVARGEKQNKDNTISKIIMYPPQQQHQPKMPIPIRPRSSLSTDEHHHRMKDSLRLPRKPSNAVLTLAGFCIFLLVLCIFLLGTLVYVGRTIVNEQNNKDFTYNTSSLQSGDEQLDGLRLSTKPILRFRPVTPTTVPPAKVFLLNKTTLAPNIMASSKVLQKLSFRLPGELRPLRYHLRLQPDLKNKTFSGNVTIRLEVLKPISFIPVHSKFLTVTTKEVMQLGENEKPVRSITPILTFEHPQLEYWVTEFADPLDIGNYTLQLAFNGSLVDRIVGFYQSSYLDKERNEKRWIATSKFEPTYARQAFPCFDEPAMKAMFTITVVRPTGDGYHALSNMNVDTETNIGGGLTEVTFAESVPMSTYLACFIVSDFDSQSKIVRGMLPGASDFEMRVFSTAAQVNKVEYALNVGVGITEYYIEYFNVSYPLPKLDMAAIPDFVSGAMEHWGLVTYRETALLYDASISSSANQQRVATVVAHELAHMWFGNLVTMKWWNDLWLNEGFASYIEYKGVHHVHPDWNMLDQFLISDLHGVMKLDATLASHPIVQTVESPNQITELFDTITYSKGASCIRMLEDLVGSEKFRNATSNYLNRFYYGNAETNDFLSELEALNFDFDIKLIMQTWTEQMGLPVVEVTRNGNTYKLTQKRFFANPEDYGTYEDSEFNYHWSIPITYTTNSNSEVQRAIFNYNDNELSVTTPAAVEWIKFNKDQVGYYRVNYPTDMWQSLINALINNRGVFSVADRAHLISDVFALADAGQVDYSIALELSKYLEKELDYVPWSVGASRLSAIKNLLYFTSLYRDFVDYARQLFKNVYKSVTWTVGEDHLQNLLRVTVLNAACGYGNPEALDEVGKRFTEWLANPSVRPKPDIRSTVYYYGMQVAGNEEKWNQVWDLFVAEQDAQEKVKLMEALAAINEPWILQRYINLAWNDSYVRGQDYFTCLQYIAQNRVGQPLVWDYVRENWPRLVERFGINERYLGRMIPSITSRFASQTKLEEMETFFAKYPEAGAGTAARKEALETVKNNKKWLEQNLNPVSKWLEAQKSSDNTETSTTVNSIN